MSPRDVDQFDRHARAGERKLRAEFDRYLAALLEVATFAVILEAIRTGSSGPLLGRLRAVRAPSFDLYRPAVVEGEASFERAEAARAPAMLPEPVGEPLPRRRPDLRLVPALPRPELQLRFDVRDPRFEAAVLEHQARLVREVTVQTQRAIALVVADAYRRGLHPYDFAPRIRATVGLTSRQSLAVLNRARGMKERGWKPERITAESERYAARLRRYRASSIARTETIRAANTGRIYGYRQAAERGLIPTGARLEWDATLDRRVCAICRGLEGTQTSLEGGDFDGMRQPPAHPMCRCTVQLVY